MYSKLESGENLYDHEILEMLLFSAFPRVNTNPIAHNLLDKFGSLSGVLKADVKELKSVEGIGDGAANFLRVVGLCQERANRVEGIAKIVNMGEFKNFVKLRLGGKREEFLELYLLDKSGTIARILSYTSAIKYKVNVEIEEVVREISYVKPAKILAAHNHLNGSVSPSEEDEAFTQELQLVCSITGVDFQDHLIYSDGKFYSFRDDGKMDEIKYRCTLEKLVEWTKNSK